MSTVPQSRRVTLFLRCCRGLIRFYPSAYRERFEEELMQTAKTAIWFGNQDSNERYVFRFWAGWIPDLVMSIARERMREWEKKMNKRNVTAVIGLILMTLWIGFIGVSEAKAFLHLSYKDPMLWLIGEAPSNLAFVAANGFLLLAPFVALVLCAMPFLNIVRPGNGDDAAEIHLQKAAGMSRAALWISGATSVLWLAVFIFGRLL